MWRSLCGMTIIRRAHSTVTEPNKLDRARRLALRDLRAAKEVVDKNTKQNKRVTDDVLIQMLQNLAQKDSSASSSSPSMGKKETGSSHNSPSHSMKPKKLKQILRSKKKQQKIRKKLFQAQQQQLAQAKKKRSLVEGSGQLIRKKKRIVLSELLAPSNSPPSVSYVPSYVPLSSSSSSTSPTKSQVPSSLPQKSSRPAISTTTQSSHSSQLSDSPIPFSHYSPQTESKTKGQQPKGQTKGQQPQAQKTHHTQQLQQQTSGHAVPMPRKLRLQLKRQQLHQEKLQEHQQRKDKNKQEQEQRQLQQKQRQQQKQQQKQKQQQPQQLQQQQRSLQQPPTTTIPSPSQQQKQQKQQQPLQSLRERIFPSMTPTAPSSVRVAYKPQPVVTDTQSITTSTDRFVQSVSPFKPRNVAAPYTPSISPAPFVKVVSGAGRFPKLKSWILNEQIHEAISAAPSSSTVSSTITPQTSHLKTSAEIVTTQFSVDVKSTTANQEASPTPQFPLKQFLGSVPGVVGVTEEEAPTTRTTLSDDEEADAAAQEKHKKAEAAYNAMHEQWTHKTKVEPWKDRAREFNMRYQQSDLLSLDPLLVQVISAPPTELINKLASGLQTVLERKGVHIVKNAIKGETDYEGTISADFLSIVQPGEIDTSSIPPFVTSSRDVNLLSAAITANSNFMGSTSSTTGLLSQIIQLLLAHRPFDMSSFSDAFEDLPKTFTHATRKPSCVVLRRRGKVLGIDTPPKYNPPSNQILIELGKSLERMFTMEPDHFQKVMVKGARRGVRGKKLPSEPSMCVKINSFMVRAQLDCQHASLPDGGVFDLKTRAVLPIRLDCKNHSRYIGYHITSYNGLLYSFEREFFDMVRSTMLKYNLQARIGQMSGIMVAYHNTQKIFGFEYVPQAIMDEHLYGSSIVGKLVFNVSTKLLDFALNSIFASWDVSDARQIRLVTHAPKGLRYVDFVVERIPEDAYGDHGDPIVKAHYAPLGVDLLGVAELQSRLRQLGLDTQGVRPSLVARLESALHAPLDADVPSLEFFQNKFQEGAVKHFRLHLYVAQHGVMVESLHSMMFADLSETDPQKFAELNGLEIRYQFECINDMAASAKRYRALVRDSTDGLDDDEARAAVAAEIPLNG